jgi:hypothetical protein
MPFKLSEVTNDLHDDFRETFPEPRQAQERDTQTKLPHNRAPEADVGGGVSSPKGHLTSESLQYFPIDKSFQKCAGESGSIDILRIYVQPQTK